MSGLPCATDFQIPNSLIMSLRSYRNRSVNETRLPSPHFEFTKSSSGESDSTLFEDELGLGLHGSRKYPRLKEFRQARLNTSESVNIEMEQDAENNNCQGRIGNGVPRSTLSSARSTSDASSSTDDEDAVNFCEADPALLSGKEEAIKYVISVPDAILRRSCLA